MKVNNDKIFGFEFTEKFKARTRELLDESQAMQFAEGIRLSSALGSVYAREYARIERKYGKDHPRTLEMVLRVAAGAEAKKNLYARYTDAATPRPDAGEGWAVDGFVRGADGDPVSGVTVAAYDRQGKWYQEFGYGCTDERGYFSLASAKLSDNPPRPVFMQASKGQKIIPSNEVQLAPRSGTTDRVAIIIGKGGDRGDCIPPESGPTPQPGKDEGKERTRYLGNSSKRELHDLKNITKRCQIDEIPFDRRVNFKTEKEALAAKYDYCAHCFGKEKSRR